MSTTYVPLISSGVAGPLGVLHLPRLWLKASLEARSKVAPGYPALSKGYDSMVLGALGLDTYPQFEAWIQKQPGVNLTPGNIHQLNVSIAGYIHTPEVRKSILAANGIPDNGTVKPDAISLNDLDDWLEFHNAVLK